MTSLGSGQRSDQKNVNRVSHKELRMDSFTFWPANESSEQVELFARKLMPRVKKMK